MTSLQKQLKELQIRPKKRLGQHFVHDPNILRKVIEAASLVPEDVVVEIGAGLGSLTEPLARRVKKVYALEIDSSLADALKDRFSSGDTVEVVWADALQFDFGAPFRRWKRKIKVVANLPYEISTPMIFRLLKERECFSLLVLMLQLEVARRLAAQPGTGDYGPLSVWSQLYSDVQMALRVKPNSFLPPPKVHSAVVKFRILPKPRVAVEDEKNLEKVVRAAFTYRRKTLGKALQLGGFSGPQIKEALSIAGISPLTRGETLNLEKFCTLARLLGSK
ncbi:MAG TPA: 16S rRNA (adenine(1518)-N(6)/adenine(1519)-N(6))-dimethyltransferase RsmA [Thermodesulfobacteriota bacterium]